MILNGVLPLLRKDSVEICLCSKVRDLLEYVPWIQHFNGEIQMEIPGHQG